MPTSDVTSPKLTSLVRSSVHTRETFMLLRSCLTELMVQVDPNLYQKYITYDKNNKALLYVKLSKAIYRLLKSTLLFYKKMSPTSKITRHPLSSIHMIHALPMQLSTVNK
jgi:hypothetical protein